MKIKKFLIILIIAGIIAFVMAESAASQQVLGAGTGTIGVLPFKIKITGADTTGNYLQSKLVAGSGITITKNSAGANETLTIASTATGGVWGTITGTLSDQTDLQTALDAKQPLDADLTTIAGLTATTNNFLVSVASAWASRTPAQVKTTLSLDNVENTALSTWAGTSNITTLGTITTGVWNGTAITNANLANSTISGVALGGTLGALTATDTSLTFSGSYTGAAARTVGLNLANANTWTGKQTFNTAAPRFGTITGSTQCLHVDTNGDISGTGADCGSGSGGLTVGTTAIASGTGGRVLYDNAGTLGEMTTTGSGTVLALATAPALTSATITTKLSPTSDDGAPLGDTTHNFSDLFLASGAVINFNNGDVTLTHSADTLTLGGGNLALGANNLTMTGSLAATGARVTKGWFTDLESTNMPTVGGTAILTSLTAPQFTTIELSHATANTLSASSGILSIEGVAIPTISSSDTLTNKTLTTPVINGTITGTGQATAATASTITMRDANANITANNWLGGYSTTATAAGTTTLTVASTYLQYFTGVTTQTVKLPVVSTLALGTQYIIVNNSTGAVTVQSSGTQTVVVLAGGTSTTVTSIATSGTDQTVWSSGYVADAVASGKKLTVSNSLTLAGTDSTTMTFPTTSATIARTDAAQTFTGVQTFSSAPLMSTLTSGRVTFATTNGGLTDDADMTFATDTLTVTKIAAHSVTGNLTMSDVDMVLGTTTGTKFGTSTSQKLAFYNSTPIVKPSGDIGTALSNLGLVSSGTLAVGSITGLGTGVGTWLATPSSANLAAALTDETGTGLAVFGTAPTFASTMTIGTAAGTTGAINFKGTTSGTVTLTVAAAAGTYTFTLPTTAGTNGQFLKTDGSGNTSWGAATSSVIPEQDIPYMTTSVTDFSTKTAFGSNISGSVVVLVVVAPSSASTATTWYRFARDASTGALYMTHKVTPALSVSTPLNFCVTVIGTKTYLVYRESTTVKMYSVNTSDMTGGAAMTFSGTAVDGSNGPGSCFTDDSNVFIQDTDNSFKKYSISGTTATFVSAITFTGAVRPRNGGGQATSDGTNVWAVTDVTGSPTFTIKKWAIAGGSSTATLTYMYAVDNWSNGSDPEQNGSAMILPYMAGTNLLGLGVAKSQESNSAVKGSNFHAWAIAAP